MLKGIDNRLNAEVLACLRAMAHGDVLIVAGTNFPSDSVARATVTGTWSLLGIMYPYFYPAHSGEKPIPTGTIQEIDSIYLNGVKK